MKAIRISNMAYEFLVDIANKEKRSLIKTLDLFVELFKEGQDAELEKESLSSPHKTKVTN